MNRLKLVCLALASVVLSSCATKDKFFVSVHSQGTEMSSPKSIMPDSVGNPPRKVILNRAPEFTQKNIAAFQSFKAENGNGNGVALRLDFKGTQALEIATRMRQGEILRSLINGKPVDYVIIDGPITDGIFVIWEGVSDEVIAEMGKKYPPINKLQSAAGNMDMTPSTKTEKKRAFSLFKKKQREEKNQSDSPEEPSGSKKKNGTADIQSPAPTDANLPLPVMEPN